MVFADDSSIAVMMTSQKAQPPPPSSLSPPLMIEVRLVMAKPPEASTFTQHKLPLPLITSLRELKDTLQAKVGVAITDDDRVVVRGKVWGSQEGTKSLADVGVRDEKDMVIVIHEEKEVMLEMMIKTPRGSKVPLLDLRPTMTVLDLKRRLASMPRLQGLVLDSTSVSIEGLGAKPDDQSTLHEVGVGQDWRVQLMVLGSRRGRGGGVCILLFGPTSEMAATM